MRLLILTQKVDINDHILGFFHRWIEEFAKHCERVTVIALGVGEYDLPKNVHVFTLGKEQGVSRLRYVYNFYRLIWCERKNYDAVFAHMNQVYVLLGGLFWMVWKKKFGLWYAHKNIGMELRVAEKLTDMIFTASRESFRLPSNKVHVVGHGIDTEVFKPTRKESSEMFTIVTTGRVSPVKDYQTLIEAVDILAREKIFIHVDIVGGPATVSDKNYLQHLQVLVQEKKLSGAINFVGPVSNKSISALLKNADLFVNMSHTGSLDKAVLEAMASGVLVLTSNEAFNEVLGSNTNMLMFTPADAHDLAGKIKRIIAFEAAKKEELTNRLRNVILEKHNIEVLVPRILSYYETSR